MTLLIRKFCLPWGKGLEILWKTNGFKSPLQTLAAVHFSNSPQDGWQRVSSKKQMWKRIKKNDPKMDYFLNLVNTQTRIEELTKVMECSVEEATELVKRDSHVGVLDGNNLYKRIQLLKSYKFSTQSIIANPSVLHRRHQVLQHRLLTLQILKCPANEISLSILKKSDREFKNYVDKRFKEEQFLSLFSSRQNCLAILLECDFRKVEKMIDENDLMSVSPLLLKDKIDVFKRFHISSDVIHNNIKVIINTSISVLESRLQLLKDNNLIEYPDVKFGYLLSCTPEDFEKSFTLLKDNYEALEGCRNVEEYLVFRLKCSEKVAEGLVSRKPIVSMSEVKLRAMLDYFLNEMNVSSHFVISNIYLFGFSIKRMQQRWPIICASGLGPAQHLPRLLSSSDDSFQKSISHV